MSSCAAHHQRVKSAPGFVCVQVGDASCLAKGGRTRRCLHSKRRTIAGLGCSCDERLLSERPCHAQPRARCAPGDIEGDLATAAGDVDAVGCVVGGVAFGTCVGDADGEEPDVALPLPGLARTLPVVLVDMMIPLRSGAPAQSVTGPPTAHPARKMQCHPQPPLRRHHSPLEFGATRCAGNDRDERHAEPSRVARAYTSKLSRTDVDGLDADTHATHKGHDRKKAQPPRRAQHLTDASACCVAESQNPQAKHKTRNSHKKLNS